jgi:aconitate hydratase 2 / 2-methylisocitrate dehydratase
MGVLTAASEKIYQYLNFDIVKRYTDVAASV